MNPFSITVFLLAAFTLAGVAQVWWLKSGRLRSWAVPLDGGRTFRGQPIFGPNKTLRGFVVMVPAAALAFVGLSGWLRLVLGSPAEIGLWELPPGTYALLGAWAGFGFMAGELPNSFLKRQLGIASGGMGERPVLRWLFFLVDRCDSILGMLIAVSLVVPLPWPVWPGMLVVGAGIHWLFNVALYLMRVKARPA